MSFHSFVLVSRVVLVALIVAVIIYGSRLKRIKARLIAAVVLFILMASAFISFFFWAGILKSIETRSFQIPLEKYASWVSLAKGQQSPDGKMLPINIGSYGLGPGGGLAYKDPRKPDIDNIYLFMPAAMRAKTPADIKTILWVVWGKSTIAQYTDYSSYYQIVCTIYVIDKEKGAIVGCRKFQGSKPKAPSQIIKPRGTGQMKDVYGSNPVKEIIRYLQTVPGRIDEGLESVLESILRDGRVIEERKPKILSTIDHGERKVYQQLLHEHWGLDDVEGWSSGTNRSVPAETELLIIAGPKKDFFPEELDGISNYLEKGGRVLLIAAPSISETSILKQGNLQAWLMRFGTILGDDLVINPNSPFSVVSFAALPYGDHPIARKLRSMKRYVYLEMARSVRCNPANKNELSTEILESGSDGWAEKDLEKMLKKRTVFKDGDDLQGPVPVALALEYGTGSSGNDKQIDKSKEGQRADLGLGNERLRGRMVVVGSDIFPEDYWNKRDWGIKGVNQYFVSAVMDWLLEGTKLFRPQISE